MFSWMHQIKNFQTLADLSKNFYSFFNITRNNDGLKAIFSYLINVPFQQIKLQTYCFILYISYCKQHFHLADNFFPFSRFPERKLFFAALVLISNYCVYLKTHWFILHCSLGLLKQRNICHEHKILDFARYWTGISIQSTWVTGISRTGPGFFPWFSFGTNVRSLTCRFLHAAVGRFLRAITLLFFHTIRFPFISQFTFQRCGFHAVGIIVIGGCSRFHCFQWFRRGLGRRLVRFWDGNELQRGGFCRR